MIVGVEITEPRNGMRIDGEYEFDSSVDNNNNRAVDLIVV